VGIAAMSAGLSRLALSRLARLDFVLAPVARGRRSMPLRLFAPLLLILGAALALVLALSESDGADGDPVVPLTPAAIEASPVDAPPAPPTAGPLSPTVAPAAQPGVTEPSAAGGLRISGQSWRRGGLGSNAQVTFTLRNDNSFAVRDVAISCAFARHDGSHLTDRTRTIPDTIRMRSQKRYARLHVGFVNINAERIKCQVVAASRI